MSTPKRVHLGLGSGAPRRARGDGDAAEVSPRRHQHGRCGDRQADGGGRHAQPTAVEVGAKAGGPEADQADQCRGGQTGGTAEDADHDRLGRRKRDQLPVVAPRARSSACSRRRRGAPASTTVAVSSAATTAAGRPRKRKSTRA